MPENPLLISEGSMEPNDALAACSRELSCDDPVGSVLGSVEQPLEAETSCSADSNADGHCEVARANLMRDGVSLKRPFSSLPSEAVGRDLKSRDTRSDPEELATRLLNSCDFSADSILELFDTLPHGSIVRSAQAGGQSFTVGSYSQGVLKGLRHYTAKLPAVCRYLSACVLHVFPDHKFSCITISDSVESQPHLDSNNGPTLNLVSPLTHFGGGSLCLHHDIVADVELDFSLGSWAFNARDCLHSVRPHSGRRVVMIAYSSRGVWELSHADRGSLTTAGFVLPTSHTEMPASPLGPLRDLRHKFPPAPPVPLSDDPNKMPAAGAPVPPAPNRALKLIKATVLDLFGHVGHFGKACASKGFHVMSYDVQKQPRTTHKVHVFRPERTAAWDFFAKVLLAHRTFHVMVFLSSSVTPDIAASIVVLLQRAKQLDVRWTVLGPSDHEAWSSLRRCGPYIELCACHLHLGSGRVGIAGYCPFEQSSSQCLCDNKSCVSASKQFAEMFAEQLRLAAADDGFLIDAQALLPQANTWVQRQAKSSKLQPIMPEYRYTVTVSVDSAALSLDSKSCLCAPLQSVPAGSRLLRLALPGGGSLKPKGSVSSSLPQGLVSATFGVYRTQSEFVSASLELEHPFDAFAYVPDGILRNLGDLLISGPLPIMRKRLALLTKWRSWASDLDRAEAELHKTLESSVARVLSGKKLLLLEKIAQSLGWPDVDLFSDIKSGFSLVGSAGVTGVFETSFKAAEFTEDELDSRAKFLRPALWGKIASSATSEFEDELWQKTLDERDKKGWITGPYTYEELDRMFGPTWLPVRRFGIRQRAKLRCIDDLSENGVNSSWEVAEKIDLRALDELLWVTSRLMKIMLDKGFVDLKLSDGSRVRGPLHPMWKSNSTGAQPVIKCVDLEAAYKQWPIRPQDSKRCVVSLRRPADGLPVGFVCHVLPFGSLASVGHFNRIARLVQRILIELGCMAFNYFDDYPVLDLSLTSGGTEKTMRSVMRLLGILMKPDIPLYSLCTLECA